MPRRDVKSSIQCEHLISQVAEVALETVDRPVLEGELIELKVRCGPGQAVDQFAGPETFHMIFLSRIRWEISGPRIEEMARSSKLLASKRGRLLLVRRRRDKLCIYPGGRRRGHETAEQCLWREIKAPACGVAGVRQAEAASCRAFSCAMSCSQHVG
ncbi:hypothetical protein LMTR13_24210 [Bradyrhizobium icense]|uniref:Uncharacterized protein n=1 Tax=Bradyrhizobium icense TaxID=1274631 RepID=A0A1B1UJ48_9BRAD|nr:hypothetical protein LMTR13_24210 [Bradyrhizobium icense]